MSVTIQSSPEFDIKSWVRSKSVKLNRPSIERGIMVSVAYADVFDYPLTASEIHRYLAYRKAPLQAIHSILQNEHSRSSRLEYYQGYYTLPGRQEIIEMRRRRAKVAARLWPKAIYYGHLIAALPFVRMVALTGALAVENVETGADLDYLVVTEAGRLWLCRALVILLVRRAALQGNIICPNYFLSEYSLVYPDRNFYTAHEMVQMVPISGLEVYWRMRASNLWTFEFLPNAINPPRENISPDKHPNSSRFRQIAEAVLRTPLAGRLERWEMERKVRKFTGQGKKSTEAAFSQDWCKGHFDRHKHQTLKAFARRLQALEICTEEESS